MPETLAVEAWLPVFELREGIVGMLVRMTRECAQRLDLAGGADPSRELRAADAAPGLNGEGELRTPEQEGSHRSEKLVLPRAQQVDEALQLRDTPRPVRGAPAARRTA